MPSGAIAACWPPILGSGENPFASRTQARTLGSLTACAVLGRWSRAKINLNCFFSAAAT